MIKIKRAITPVETDSSGCLFEQIIHIDAASVECSQHVCQLDAGFESYTQHPAPEAKVYFEISEFHNLQIHHNTSRRSSMDETESHGPKMCVVHMGRKRFRSWASILRCT